MTSAPRPLDCGLLPLPRSLKTRLSINYALRCCLGMALLMWGTSFLLDAVDHDRLTRPERIERESVRLLEPIGAMMENGDTEKSHLASMLVQARDHLLTLEEYDFMGNLYRITQSSEPRVLLTLLQPGSPPLTVGDAEVGAEQTAVVMLTKAEPASSVLVRFAAPFQFGRELTNSIGWVLGAWPIIVVSSSVIGILCGSAASAYVVSRLGAMNMIVERWRAGDLTPRITLPPGDELTAHAEHLNGMAGDLAAHVALRNRVAAQAERYRVACDLHDTVKQKLFALSLQVAAIRSRLAQAQGVQANLAEAEAILHEAQTDVAALLDPSHNKPLSGGTLREAVRSLTAEYSRRFGVVIDHQIDTSLENLFTPVDALIKIIQECLTNVVRHSKADRAEIKLTQVGPVGTLVVRDAGRGFDPTTVTAGVGLGSIKTRALNLPGGRFEIASRQGNGCQITVVWDLMMPPHV